jgi:hypothetical protein
MRLRKHRTIRHELPASEILDYEALFVGMRLDQDPSDGAGGSVCWLHHLHSSDMAYANPIFSVDRDGRTAPYVTPSRTSQFDGQHHMMQSTQQLKHD